MSRKTWKSKDTWKVDHTLDDPPLGMEKYPEDSSDRARTDTVTSLLLETPAEKSARKRSLAVAYTTMFIMSIGFSIVLTGVWPYLHSLDPSKEKSALGWVVAANPFGQMLAAPLLGFWGNRAGTVRFAMIVSVLCFIGGNVMYSLLHAFEDSADNVAYAMMILSRFIVGVSSANVTLCRSYVAGATTVKERTIGLSIISASQALGFVVGPGIQAVMTLLIKDTYDTGLPGLVFDRYTATSWVAALLGLINFVIVMPCVFQEYYIARKEQELINKKSEEEVKLPKADYCGIVGLLVSFFFVLFIYVLIETLAEPFVADQYALTDEQAIVATGAALMGGGILSIVMYVITNTLSKKGYDERKIMLFMGFIPMLIGTALYLPFTGDDIIISECNGTDMSAAILQNSFSNFSPNSPPTHVLQSYERVMYLSGAPGDESSEVVEDCSPGCPPEQDWCNYVPQLPLAQCITAFFITIMGYPVFIALAQATFSKMLGPKPQGLWMGVLTGVGSLSRITGPIFVSYVYTLYGTYVTFGIVLGGMVCSLCILLVNYKRLVPMKVPTLKKSRDNPAWEDDKV